MKLKYKIEGIFPTPVYRTKLTNKIGKTENNLINEIKNESSENLGNFISDDKYVLERPGFKKIKKELLKHLKEYYKIVCCFKDSEPYLTQSWLNFTSEEQYHHKHEHPNSMVSGVLYLNANLNNDKIQFWKDCGYQRIRPDVTEFNWFNAESWWFEVESKDLILFPSSLTHSVETKKGNNIRTSLAFNSFIKGNIGSEIKVNSLYLK